VKVGIWLAIVLTAVPAVALAQEPEVDPDADVAPLNAVPRELAAGEQVTVTGDGCGGAGRVQFHLYYPAKEQTLSVDAPVESDGTFSQAITVPINAPPGRVWLHATCLNEDRDERILETVLLVSDPPFLVTWTNVLFGAGTSLVVMGGGIRVLRRRHDRRIGKAVRSSKKSRNRRPK
jgi:hypothetical protein